MKVGIMSMQRVVNYGSYLQAYGLKKTLEFLGHEVEFVDYKPEGSLVEENGSKNGRISDNISRVLRMLSPSYRRWREKQIRSNRSFQIFYDKFIHDFLPELGVEEVRNETPKLDVLVIGSDEVFNCTQAGQMVGYSRQLFGAERRANKLISYAASFGSTTLEKLNQYGIAHDIRHYLGDFDAISVRDQNSFELVKNLCGVCAEQHIDPVLLYDFSEVDQISTNFKNYIVVYAYAGRISEEEAKWIHNFANKKGKKLISLGFWQTFCDDYVLASPLEALAYIRDADYVITDTFHGTVFSIKYQKRFAVIVRDCNKQKLTDLLSQFGLDERRINNMADMECILENGMDKENISSLLQQKQQVARIYLTDTLS